MRKKMNDAKCLNTYYSKDGRKHAVINATSSSIYIEFYTDDIIVGGIEVSKNSIYYAQSIAENFCNGIIQVKPWGSNEVLERNLRQPDSE